MGVIGPSDFVTELMALTVAVSELEILLFLFVVLGMMIVVINNLDGLQETNNSGYVVLTDTTKRFITTYHPHHTHQNKAVEGRSMHLSMEYIYLE